MDLFIITLDLKDTRHNSIQHTQHKNAERVLMVNMRVVVMLSVIILGVRAGNPYCRGRLSTVDLLVLTGSNHLDLEMKMYFTFFTKQATLTRRSTVLSFPLQLVFPGQGDPCILACLPLVI